MPASTQVLAIHRNLCGLADSRVFLQILVFCLATGFWRVDKVSSGEPLSLGFFWEGSVIKPFPVVTIEQSPSTERFHQWARQFGIFRLGRSLGVDFRTVRYWFASDIRPVISKAKEIIAHSTLEPLAGTPLTYDDIYGTARAASVEVRHVKKV